MKRYYFRSSISQFIISNPDEIIGKLAKNNEFPLEQTQKNAWIQEISLLKTVLEEFQGELFFEYSIPRMGKRIDVVCIIGAVIFILEFKVGEKQFSTSALDQVMDYALDLKNFHLYSHDKYLAPVLICTKAENEHSIIGSTPQNDKLLFPIKSNNQQLQEIIHNVLRFTDGEDIDSIEWEKGNYSPTPTIVEAAMALYRGHSVNEISRSDANAINLSRKSSGKHGQDRIMINRDSSGAQLHPVLFPGK